MRLIDADAIYVWRCPHSISETREWIDEEPTVEAIPVEWIKTRIEYALSMMGKDTYVDCYTMVSYSFTAQCLTRLLELWEMENEIN